jgi:hypothetical protein
MPPILTGDHPLPGNADINAPVRTIVNWQSLYRASDDRDMPRIRAELVERCPLFFRAHHAAQGQSEKNSARVYVFRFALKLRHWATQPALPICARTGL